MCVRVLAVVTIASLIGGCGVRTTYSPDGAKVSEVFFGPGSTYSCEGSEGTTVSVATLGLWGSSGGSGLGYHEARFFCGSPKCQVVIWPEANTDVQALRQAYGQLGNVCVVEKGN